MSHDVFISHSSKDKTVADATCAYLEGRGIRCWVAPRDIRPGSTWGSSIINAIRGSRVMILIFSSHANASPQIHREVERAVNFGVAIIPMRIEDVAPQGDMEYFLGVPHWLDAFGSPLESHLVALASAVNEILAIPIAVPKSPVGDAEAEPEEPLLDRHSAPLASPEPPSRQRSSKSWWIGLGIAALVLGGVAYFFSAKAPADKAPQAEKAKQIPTILASTPPVAPAVPAPQPLSTASLHPSVTNSVSAVSAVAATQTVASTNSVLSVAKPPPLSTTPSPITPSGAAALNPDITVPGDAPEATNSAPSASVVPETTDSQVASGVAPSWAESFRPFLADKGAALKQHEHNILSIPDPDEMQQHYIVFCRQLNYAEHLEKDKALTLAYAVYLDTEKKLIAIHGLDPAWEADLVAARELDLVTKLKSLVGILPDTPPPLDETFKQFLALDIGHYEAPSDADRRQFPNLYPEESSIGRNPVDAIAVYKKFQAAFPTWEPDLLRARIANDSGITSAANSAAHPPLAGLTPSGNGNSTSERLPDEMRPVAQQAADFFKSGRYDEAADCYRQIIDKYPLSLYAWSNLGVVRFQQGNYQEALGALEQAVKLSPNDPFSCSNLGISYYQLHRYSDAAEALKRAISLDPNDAKSHNYLGCIYSQLGYREQAEAEFKRAVQLNHGLGDAYFNLSLLYATATPQRTELARECYAQALKLGIVQNQRLEKLLNGN